MKLKIVEGDVFNAFALEPSNSADLVLTSPPYWGLRSYGVEGELGAEPTLEAYLDNTMKWVKEAWRVLKPTGSLVLNLGGSYFGSWGGGYEKQNPIGAQGTQKYGALGLKVPERTARFYKAKQFLDVGSFAYQRIITETDFVCRNRGTWCLDENTLITIGKENNIKTLSLKELNNEKGEFEVPAPQRDGNTTWVKAKIIPSGLKECFEITLTNGLQFIASGEHIVPVSQPSSQNPRYLKLRHKKVGELQKNPSNSLLILNNFKHKENNNNNDYLDGFTVGFYLAEGNSYLDTRKGNTKSTIMFSGHSEKDKDNFVLIEKRYKLNKYVYKNTPNEIVVRSHDKNLRNLIETFICDNTSKNKRLNNLVWNQNIKFLNGVFDGFAKGDGHYRIDGNGGIRFSLTVNENLKNDLFLLCRFLGYKIRSHNNYFVKLNGKSFETMRFQVYPEFHNYGDYGVISKHSIRSIKLVGNRFCYDLQVEEQYPNYRSGTKWNNLFALANGIVVHNCKPNVPSPIRSRLKQSTESVDWFVKDADEYYFNPKPWMKPIAQSSISRDKYEYTDRSQMQGSLSRKIEKQNYENKETIEHSWRVVGSGAEEPKEIKVRENLPNLDELANYLKESLKKSGKTVAALEAEMGGFAAHHFFEGEKWGCYPSIEQWFVLKKLLGFDDKFDKQMTDFTLKLDYCHRGQGLGGTTTIGSLKENTIEHSWRIIPVGEKQKGFELSGKEKQEHVAPFPEALIKPWVESLCPARVCEKCGKPIKHYTENLNKQKLERNKIDGKNIGAIGGNIRERMGDDCDDLSKRGVYAYHETPSCSCGAGFTAGVVLDPFLGSGTTLKVARDLHLNGIGFDLNPQYASYARKRLNWGEVLSGYKYEEAKA